MTKRILPQESYYDAAPLDTYLPARPLPILLAVLIIAAGAFRLGMMLGPLWDQRGWGALLVFSIVGSVYMVNRCNRED